MTANASSIVFLQTYRSSMSYSIPKKKTVIVFISVYTTHSPRIQEFMCLHIPITLGTHNHTT